MEQVSHHFLSSPRSSHQDFSNLSMTFFGFLVQMRKIVFPPFVFSVRKAGKVQEKLRNSSKVLALQKV